MLINIFNTAVSVYSFIVIDQKAGINVWFTYLFLQIVLITCCCLVNYAAVSWFLLASEKNDNNMRLKR